MASKPKYEYRIEADILGRGWQTLVGEQDGSLEYMRGRFVGFRESGSPRPAFRLVRIDPSNPAAEPKVLDETKARTELSVGMLPQACGFQWEAYARAAARALRVAASDVRAAARHGQYAGHSERFAALADEVEALCTRPEK